MTHTNNCLFNFFSANSIAKVRKSPESQISEMPFPIDNHRLQVWNNYLRIGIFKNIKTSLLWNSVYGICFFVKLYKISWWQINSKLSIGLNFKFYMLLNTYCFQKSHNCNTVGVGLQVNDCVTYINDINIDRYMSVIYDCEIAWNFPASQLTHSAQCSHFILPENTKKPKIFWCSQGI